MTKCADCIYWIKNADSTPITGKCEYAPPLASLIPVQGIGGNSLSVVSYWPETAPHNGCSHGEREKILI